MLLNTIDLGRRAVAEAVGTAMLVTVIVGSGIAAERLSPGQPGLQLLINAAATAGGLVALILAFGPISGAHLNPAVTLALRTPRRQATAYVGAQFAGCIVGVVVANLMFELPAVTLSTRERSSPALWLGEAVATFGLVAAVLLLVRSGRTAVVAYAVAGYIAAGYWFTSSTSFANPAVTVARTLTDTFTGIAPSSAPAFLASQAVGAIAAVALVRYLTTTRISVPVLDDR